MPLQCMQAMYWPGDGVQNTAPPSAVPWNSVAAVAASTFCFLLMALGGSPVALAALPFFDLGKLVPMRVRLLWRLCLVVFGPDFKRATDIVHEVNGLGIKNSSHWGEIGQRVGQIQGVGENVFRHLRATELYDGDVSNVQFGKMHVRNLTLELAYYASKELR